MWPLAGMQVWSDYMMFNRNCHREKEKTFRHDCLFFNYFFLDVPEMRIRVALFGNSSHCGILLRQSFLAKEAALIVEQRLNLGFTLWLMWMAPLVRWMSVAKRCFLVCFFFCNQWEKRFKVSGQTAAALHLIRKCPTISKRRWVNRKL